MRNENNTSHFCILISWEPGTFVPGSYNGLLLAQIVYNNSAGGDLIRSDLDVVVHNYCSADKFREYIVVLSLCE